VTDFGTAESPSERSLEEIECELEGLKQAHLQNETTRDAFLALAHTALFAASVSFVGDLARDGPARILWLLIVGWSASIVGLCTLTFSYFEAARHIRRRHNQVYAPVADEPRVGNALNAIALGSFPVALISTFIFAAANMLRP
jgi:hypothetical protein